jgi:hypothetical protein
MLVHVGLRPIHTCRRQVDKPLYTTLLCQVGNDRRSWICRLERRNRVQHPRSRRNKIEVSGAALKGVERVASGRDNLRPSSLQPLRNTAAGVSAPEDHDTVHHGIIVTWGS